MKIQNYDVNVELARKALDCVPFILDVISVCKPCQMDAEQPLNQNNLPTEPIWKLTTHDYNDVANMIHQIPIYLTQKDNEGIDPLGTYVHENAKSPYIKIYAEEIQNAADNDQKFKWLFTKVLLHEVMHAIMDVYNQVGFAGRETQRGSGEYRKWREESYANGGALWIIREYAELHPSQENKEFVKYVKNFIAENQVDGYKLGLKVAKFPVRYLRHWIDEKMGKSPLDAEYKKWCSFLSKEDKAKLNIK